jgi:type VI secretion system protein ImpM
VPAESVGFFGKLPSHGDFLVRRVPGAFRDCWDSWLQRCIAESQRTLGSAWLDCYLTSPIWRFFLSDGVAGASSFGGVLLPSVDRVGRYFPFTVVVELPTGISPLQFAELGNSWFEEVEQLTTEALQSREFELVAFDAALMATGAKLAGLDRLEAEPVFPGTSTQWRWPIRSVKEVASGLGPVLIVAAQRALRPLTLWWTDGSDQVQPSALLIQSLPQPTSFAALLAGNWADGHWDGRVAMEPVTDTLTSAVSFRIISAGVTDAGTVRDENQDNFARDDANRLWAVADGMGGHSRGDVASQMVIDALNDLESTATLNSALQAVHVALQRVNSDLQRSALSVGAAEKSGSTVVALVVRGTQWGVTWAGDSRAYLYRDGKLSQLTRDHSPIDEATGDDANSLAMLISGPGIITRAVGGDVDLQLDQIADTAAAGDRFLLCSDGLYRALDETSIVACLAQGTAEEASQALIGAARDAEADDNVTAVIVDIYADV